LSNQTLALFLALASTLAFSSSSLIFADFSRKISVLWMNCFKSAVAFILLCITLPLFFGGWHKPEPLIIGGFLLSGLIGLNIADLFILNAFTRIGVARTLILFGFQPLMVGFGASLLFHQPMNPMKLVAVAFMIACLFTLSLEKYRTDKTWELTGLAIALFGVALDSCGILITRTAFEATVNHTPFEGHFYRCLGALIGFAVMSFVKPLPLIQGFMNQSRRSKALLILGSFGGTYLSLLLYLNAIKIGHLASISGIAITGPMFATALESALKKKPPSTYLLVAFCFFAAGFYVLLTTS
jgi:drug/metabolite transporter (DMT)-like permease